MLTRTRAVGTCQEPGLLQGQRGSAVLRAGNPRDDGVACGARVAHGRRRVRGKQFVSLLVFPPSFFVSARLISLLLLSSSRLISSLTSSLFSLSLSLSPPSLSSNSLVDAQELEKGSVGSQSYWNRRGGRRRRAVGRGGESKEQLPPLLLLFLLRLLLLPHPLLPLLLLTVRRRVLSRCSTSSTLPAFIHSFHSFF